MIIERKLPVYKRFNSNQKSNIGFIMTRVCIVSTDPANTTRCPSAGPMLARRRRQVNVSCLLDYESTDQQTRDAIPIPFQCWARVTDPTPAPDHVTCSLGMHGKSNYGGND